MIEIKHETLAEIVLPVDPASLTTAQEKGVRIVKTKSGKMIPTFFKKKRAVENERLLTKALRPFAPKSPYSCEGWFEGLGLFITYFFPYTSSTPKKIIGACNGGMFVPMTQRPDVDNISKAVIDVMTKCGFFVDDSQISELVLRKFRAVNPCIVISIVKQTAEDK